ncbi:cupin domain-containing protein [Porticoccaceae bacterium]|jgi:transcriptional regulator with XRE-family HTH domain|nr:cupin domain-containing protein [Porticoccaceae bacterium]CAI8375779.1 MAG: HTH-type transcriptional regulator PuuR [SAR92 bacterium MED-G29]|tara:strand:- start:8645 stop:9193 length:549 start_codon:yes stop_codon:yes gene_type:complete
MEHETGRRLREIRTKTGLSQRQLAKTSGVANATISQIESGAMNPTVGMLKKVLGGIPISLSDFFADDFSFSEQVFFSADNLLELGDKGVSYLQVGNHLHNKAIQMMKESYQPGAHTGKHAIQHEGEECGIILRGTLEVQVGDEKKVLKAGDAYYFKSTIPHHFKNVGREPCELITACSPPSF